MAEYFSLQCFDSLGRVTERAVTHKNLALAIGKGSSVKDLCGTWTNLEQPLENRPVKQSQK